MITDEWSFSLTTSEPPTGTSFRLDADQTQATKAWFTKQSNLGDATALLLALATDDTIDTEDVTIAICRKNTLFRWI